MMREGLWCEHPGLRCVSPFICAVAAVLPVSSPYESCLLYEGSPWPKPLFYNCCLNREPHWWSEAFCKTRGPERAEAWKSERDLMDRWQAAELQRF